MVLEENHSGRDPKDSKQGGHYCVFATVQVTVSPLPAVGQRKRRDMWLRVDKGCPCIVSATCKMEAAVINF